jgi:RHS repeat-associated protein
VTQHYDATACVYDFTSRFVHFAYRSTGKERDAESGNDYFEARYYSSAMGRFMSPDWSAKEDPVPYAQLDDPQSLNLYSYVLNNPLTREDADGHWPDWVDHAVQQGQKWVADHPRTVQAVKGGVKVVAAVATVAVAAGTEVGTSGVATAGVVFAVQGAVAMGVSGVTDIAGAATKTDVSEANKALEAVSNPAGQIVTAATGGNLEAGAKAAAVGDALVGAANLKSDVKEIAGLVKAGGAANDVKATVKAANIGQTAVNTAQQAQEATKKKNP